MAHATQMLAERRTAQGGEGAGGAGAGREALAADSAHSGVRRVLLCRVIPGAVAQLRARGERIEHAASAALAHGLDQVGESTGSEAGANEPEYIEGHRPLAVPVPQPLFGAVLKVALDHFRGDARAAAGWLIARGVGFPMAAPSRRQAARRLQVTPLGAVAAKRGPSVGAVKAATIPTSVRAVAPAARTVARAPAVDAPSGAQLRASREELGVSQRELAAAAGLSRGLVAEVERGRRTNPLTRLRLAETLRALGRGR